MGAVIGGGVTIEAVSVAGAVPLEGVASVSSKENTSAVSATTAVPEGATVDAPAEATDTLSSDVRTALFVRAAGIVSLAPSKTAAHISTTSRNIASGFCWPRARVASSRVETPLSTKIALISARCAATISVSRRSPTKTVEFLSRSNFCINKIGIRACGLPTVSGDVPQAVSIAETIAPAPGTIPSTTGNVESRLVAMNRAPLRMKLCARHRVVFRTRNYGQCRQRHNRQKRRVFNHEIANFAQTTHGDDACAHFLERQKPNHLRRRHKRKTGR